MKNLYLNIEDVIQNMPLAPDLIDEITVKYRDIKLHIYGILHGVTGGPNKEYRDLVRKTINQAAGLKMGEKGLRLPYPNLEIDLEDWAPVRFEDAFLLTLRVLCTPNAIGSIIYGAINEPRRKKDPYGEDGFGRLQDLGGSPRFHLIAPLTRRSLIGFPTPEHYLRINLDRRQGIASPRAVRFPDPSWAWLTTIEPIASIPLRSLHMLEFAAERALLAGYKEASLFVGEIHNTDIAWLAENLTEETLQGDWNTQDLKIIESVRKIARIMAEATNKGDTMILRRIPYLGGLGLGAAPLAAAACVVVAAL